MAKHTHYVAHLKIERVDKETPEPSSSYGRTDESVKAERREVNEVTQLIVKAEELETLLDKLGKHIELIGDD